MPKPPCPTITENPLPQFHFAILFEGAWIFTQDPNGGPGILAICPLNDDMHQCQFGIWDSASNDLDKVDGFGDTTVPPQTGFNINISPDQIVRRADDFSTLFKRAASEYPFIYLPATHPGPDPNKEHPPLKIRGSAITNGRTVLIPLPTCVRAAGALLTAEVGGDGKKRLFGQELVVKRAFTTFLFIYEYRESLNAEVCTTDNLGVRVCGCVTADEELNPTPHLIFRVFPTVNGMMAMFTGKPMSHREMDASGAHDMSTPDPDDSMQKVHASMTFEMVRQAIPQDTTPSVPCCNMALYHDQDMMTFDCGDTGLTECELGISPCTDQKEPRGPIKGPKLPTCASGGVVAETKGILEG